MSAIAKTASITLLTGVPGNGKTLRAVWYIKQAIASNEQVFVSNLADIAIEGVLDFPDPTKWEELPSGAILVVDEAQRFFRAASGAVPAYIQAMETIRHEGIRLILITQSPALIHANIRALVGLHEHLVRENGKESAIVYRRSRVIDNVRSDRALACEDHETWVYPKECYGLYKSAEIHTVKRTISSRAKRAMMLFAIAGLLLAYVIWQVRSGMSKDEKIETQQKIMPTDVAFDYAAKKKEEKEKRWETTADYIEDHLPRIPAAPWTAPVFDDRSVASDPELFCMSSGQGLDGSGNWKDHSCTCITEQGTKYEIGLAQCRTLASRGPVYNPYGEERNNRSSSEHPRRVSSLGPRLN